VLATVTITLLRTTNGLTGTTATSTNSVIIELRLKKLRKPVSIQIVSLHRPRIQGTNTVARSSEQRRAIASSMSSTRCDEIASV